ncbi:hypothetical protein Tco_0243952 [Tanacetum coccineum]
MVKAYQIYFCCCKDWKLLFFDVATSFDSAVHRVHVVSFDAAVLDVAATVSAACIVAAGYIVSADICDDASSSVLAMFVSADGIKSFLLIMFLLVMFSFLLIEIESAVRDVRFC